jgi:hypothetical protein
MVPAGVGVGHPDGGPRSAGPQVGFLTLTAVLRTPAATVISLNTGGPESEQGVAGKPKMQAIGACMRKLVMLCYGVLKNRTPFDADWASKKGP